MKRTPLKRTKKLGRQRMRSGKRKSKYARRKRDRVYMGWVKTLPCLLAAEGQCSGVVEADHAGLDSGIGRKAPDRTCIPLCSRHHWDRHHTAGFFRGRGKDANRQWRLGSIAKTQAEFEAVEWFHGEMDEEMF